MIRKPVKSSIVVSVGYDEKEKILEVEFKSGVYQYFEVPKKTYEQALKAPSIGKFIWSNIRGRYRFSK